MIATGHYKIACPHCGIHIEFPHELHDTLSECPGCGCSVSLVVPCRPKTQPLPICQPAVIPVRAPEIQNFERRRIAKINTKTESLGAGCFVQGIGLILLFFFPIGTIVGLVMLIAGHVMAKKFFCGDCGNPVASKSVRLCPACHCQLKSGFFS